MSGFSDQFQSYIVPSEAALRTAVTEGMIVLDTNVLLNAYRFAPAARQELLAVLDMVRDRLWIPHQVALEFHQNRFDVIAEHDAAYKLVLDAVHKHQEATANELEEKIRQLANRAALADDERKSLLGMVKINLESLREAVESLRQQHGVSDPATDSILGQLQELFAERVGGPFDEAENEEARIEAERRVKKRIPPGYRDAGKDESHGDYFVWRQTLAEAKHRGVKALIFVTGDVKEDWYLRVKGQTVMAHPYLSTECGEVAGAGLHMMQVQSLLHHARAYLQAQVSADTIRQASKISAVEAAEVTRDAIQRELRDTEARRQDALMSAERTEQHLTTLVAEGNFIRDSLAQLADSVSLDEVARRESLQRRLTDIEIQQDIMRTELDSWRKESHTLGRKIKDLFARVERAEMEHVRAMAELAAQ